MSADRLEFIRQILQSAPAGQFDAMLKDIQTLASDPLEKELLEEIQLQHDHQTCVSNSDSASDHPLAAPLRAQLEEAASQQQQPEKSATIRRETIIAPETDVLLLRTYAERIDDAQCRTGSWTAEWTIRSAPSSQEAEVSGRVSTCAFSFEDGNNVQVRSTKDFTATTITSDALLAQAIVQQIAKWEDQVRASLRDSSAATNQSLKSIRGILPITHTRLNWNVVTQRTVRNLQETVNK